MDGLAAEVEGAREVLPVDLPRIHSGVGEGGRGGGGGGELGRGQAGAGGGETGVHQLGGETVKYC